MNNIERKNISEEGKNISKERKVEKEGIERKNEYIEGKEGIYINKNISNVRIYQKKEWKNTLKERKNI